MKTKNYHLHFSFYHCWYNWALPLHINIESFDNDYFEINLQILCCSFSFVVVSHKFARKVDNLFNRDEFANECYECGYKWTSDDLDDPCPECGEMDNIGMDTRGDNNDQ